MGVGGRYPNYGIDEAWLRQQMAVRDGLIRKLASQVEVTPPLLTSAGPIRPAEASGFDSHGQVALTDEEWDAFREVLAEQS